MEVVVVEVKRRMQAGWNGWRRVSGVICDRRLSACERESLQDGS